MAEAARSCAVCPSWGAAPAAAPGPMIRSTSGGPGAARSCAVCPSWGAAPADRAATAGVTRAPRRLVTGW
jgi:hypothetical protein